MKTTKPEIIEGNKLIANFCMIERMEDNKFFHFNTDLFSNLFKQGKIDGNYNKWYSADELEFHCNWEWLMPVFQKISNTYCEHFPINVGISPDSGVHIAINESNASGNKYEGKREIANTLNCNYFNDYPDADKIPFMTACWDGAIQFIKWYNKNKSKVTNHE